MSAYIVEQNSILFYEGNEMQIMRDDKVSDGSSKKV